LYGTEPRPTSKRAKYTGGANIIRAGGEVLRAAGEIPHHFIC